MNELASLIVNGLPTSPSLNQFSQNVSDAIDNLFGGTGRYQGRSKYSQRVAFMADSGKVSFAGLVHEDSPTSGVYGGMSLIWFPIPAAEDRPPKSLITFVCGTRGLAPDEQILGRPGHVRHLHGLRRYLKSMVGVNMWVKQDPTNLAQPFPSIIAETLPDFKSTLNRYGNYIYACAEVSEDQNQATEVVKAFFDFYAWERGWQPLRGARGEIDRFKVSLRENLFPRFTHEKITELLKRRRFVILQGPPGTGKTHLARKILKNDFDNHGITVQFHPAVTYETFMVGLSPDVQAADLKFKTQEGWLTQAIRSATLDGQEQDYLLHIDEINRGDLGRVLGEAIYLFEPREINAGEQREIQLPHPLPNGCTTISIPKELFILGTMNSADRSIAILDLAVRRRFAFVTIWPDLEVIRSHSPALAVDAFSRLQDIFAQYAPQDTLAMLPGHAYFLAETEEELSDRFQYELIPLLQEYLMEGRLGACESEIHAFLDWLEGKLIS